MTKTIKINPVALGQLVLGASRHVWMPEVSSRGVDVGIRDRLDYEHFISLLSVCDLDEVVIMDRMVIHNELLLNVYREWSADMNFKLIGQKTLEWIQKWTKKPSKEKNK